MSKKFGPNQPAPVTNSLTKLDFHADVNVDVDVGLSIANQHSEILLHINNSKFEQSDINREFCVLICLPGGIERRNSMRSLKNRVAQWIVCLCKWILMANIIKTYWPDGGGQGQNPENTAQGHSGHNSICPKGGYMSLGTYSLPWDI